PNVVRGSLAGSVISNMLLVLGAALIAGEESRVDRRALLVQLGLVFFAVVLLLIPSVPGWHGNPDRHSLALVSIGPAALLIVGNAAEHGGAILIARRGKMRLATDIAVSSSAQVGLFVVPLVMLMSLAFSHPLTLSFRPIELITMGIAAVTAAAVVRDGCARRREGVLLVVLYGVMVVAFGLTPDRA